MKTSIFSVLALLMIVTLISGVPGIWNEAMGDDDDDERRQGMRYQSSYVNPAKNSLYAEECGGCHLAYAPGLLPTASWDKLMTGLKDHFGDNAELDADSMAQISKYLRANSADASGYQRSRRFAYKARGPAPLRITELPYFKQKHREIPQRIIESKQVGNLSRCGSCHQDAAKGVFDEDNVYIKGVGRWDD